MTFYITTHLSILFLGLYYETLNSKKIRSYKKKIPSYFFTLPSFALLFTLAAFRGDFTTDYNNYVTLFHRYSYYSFWDLLSLRHEPGFVLLNKFIGAFSSNETLVFIAVSLITLTCYYRQFSKHSTYIWLSVLMFVTIGSYYPSFNIMRQILAAAIIFSGSKYLYERKFFRYLLVVLLASFFHSSSLIMIVFYFILNFRISLRNFIVILLGSVFSLLFLDNIIDIVRTHFYTSYTDDAYGMTGAAITTIVLPVTLLIFVLFNLNKLDRTNTIHRVWLNSVIFYALFSIVALNVYMVERFTHFFTPYIMLLIPYVFSKINPKELRFVFMMTLILLLFLYHYFVFNGTQYDPYYFIWDVP